MYLSGAERIKLAYVSRNLTSMNKTDQHTILKVDSYSFDELKHELQVNPEDSWRIIKYLINCLSKL